SALLQHEFDSWLNILQKHGIEEDDDPVPEAVSSVLWDLETQELDNLFYALNDIPYRKTKNFDSKLREARKAISEEIRQVWKKCIRKIKLRLPLLILDEAHHLKNEQTRLSSLFYSPDAEADADELQRGPLAGVFERMLFLTATPFQLGHYELCSVLERFRGITWRKNSAPPCGKEGFIQQINELRDKLDAAQIAALRLDNTWGNLRYQDLIIEGNQYQDVDTWWQNVKGADSITETTRLILKRFNQTHENMKQAEEALKPWVIRHLKAKKLPKPNNTVDRRTRILGSAITGKGSKEDGDRGLGIDDTALLPFLLAARAAVYMPESRPVFAEGLASSYEAFLHTRKLHTEKTGNTAISNTDIDDDMIESHGEIDDRGTWYLSKLEALLPKENKRGQSSHPKIGVTVKRAVDLWLEGEKVLIFCHYIATGRALRQHVSEAIQNTITQLGAKKIGCLKKDALSELDKIGNRFFDIDSPLRKACDSEIINILQKYPEISEHSERIIDVVRRFLRTPSFLVRYFPLKNLDPQRDVARAFRNSDSSGLSLHSILEDFFKFLIERCGESERINYLDAIDNIQTGSIMGADIHKTYSEDEIQGDRSERFVPNVRLVNGQTKQETRRKLMLTFNTPFYPEILIASSVMAEGVDLHLSCRYVIHHDLCWNPSTLEQRTGRIDRIGAKVERCGKPLFVYIPYVAETQDEKMFRVVMDRERWFKVVMGEQYKTDVRTTDKLAERIPLPQAAADFLAFRLDV
ncbi:MAG TPA: hypothetical protein ENG83_09055, partial [Nitrospirae bacterium]|nr:hypothetical protein [Nitrospirota bacterium]